MFDAVTLAAVADELNEKILRGRVQDVVQLDARSFGFEIYAQHQRQYLYLTAHPDDARVHLVTQKLRGPSTSLRTGAPTALLLLLRKYARAAFVRAIEQLPHERVLKIQFDHATEGITTLVVETIGKYSNIILLDADDVVLNAVKRVGADINRARVTLPRHAYAPPPPQVKIHPSILDPSDVARVLASNPRALLRQTLVSSIAGVSPLLAREITFRVTGQSDALNDPRYAAPTVETLGGLSRPPWSPCVAFEDGEPAAFAPYALTQFAETRAFDSISAAIESFYGAAESYAAVKEPLRAQIADARDRLARKRDALSESLPRAEEVERLRVSGETILAHAHAIARGQEILKAEIGDWRLEIPLDPTLSVSENAQRYFKEYHRQKDARARVPALLAAANAEVEYAEQMLNDLDLAENRAEIDAAVAAAREAGLIAASKRRVKVTPSAPREFTSRDGFTILVGKNARQNEEVTFRRARVDDVWLHARNDAGAHVIIVRAGREIPETTITEAAQLAAYYSAARGDTRVDVIVAPRRNVQRVRGGRAGTVTVRGEKNLTVTPRGNL
ncbi:MAG: NFACT RNA binding domain-containing protein [Chloroflexota bacterium]